MALAVGDDALLELLLDLLGLGLGLGDLGVLLGRADHVLKAHRGAGDRGEAVAELLEAVDSRDGDVVPGDLVAVEDQLADLGLGALLVEEAHLLRPHVVEDHAAGGGLDRAAVGDAVGGVPPCRSRGCGSGSWCGSRSRPRRGRTRPRRRR